MEKGGGHGGERERERPRLFDKKAKSFCWSKAEVVPGRHPDRWRRDAAGNVVCKRFCNCSGCLCFEYDHILPFSKGGESTADNCQILQTRVNRYKSDKEIDPSILRGYSCDLKFSGGNLEAQTESLLNVEKQMRLAGDVAGTKKAASDILLLCFQACAWKTLNDQIVVLSKRRIMGLADQELDVVEMAVYGDVIRPGNQCRCRSVAEMLGKFKSKDQLAPCKLPNENPQA